VRPRRGLLLLALYATLVVGGLAIGRWLMDLTALDVRPSNEPEIHAMVMVATVTYVIASAVPFVPGAEIGFGLILVLGARIALLVYGSMVVALTLAWLVGRLIPHRATAAALAFFGLHRARDLVLQTAQLDARERLVLMTERAPRRIVPFLLRHRYVALAVALNLPGNTLLGGGGGISLAAGMSGIYPFAAFVTTVAVAVAPVPLFVLVAAAPP